MLPTTHSPKPPTCLLHCSGKVKNSDSSRSWRWCCCTKGLPIFIWGIGLMLYCHILFFEMFHELSVVRLWRRVPMLWSCWGWWVWAGGCLIFIMKSDRFLEFLRLLSDWLTLLSSPKTPPLWHFFNRDAYEADGEINFPGLWSYTRGHTQSGSA